MTGTRITVPPLKTDLYKKGFEGVCKLDRKSDGEKLSNLVERISEPLVIALDAPWGAGKSVFLQCWVGAHTLENQGTATTVYFDAFKHDYMDDPLVSIVQAISERIESLAPKEDDTDDTSKIDAMKQTFRKASVYAPALGRAALRMGVAAGTGGLIRNIDDVAKSVLDEAAEQGAKELNGAIGDFWKAEEVRSNAMDGFRKYLQELAAEQKLVIVIDELDRCRPDYALNLLEVIKHFFDVDNVHFVLGVNRAELENSVRARYGSGVDAGTYLQKFISVTMPLPQRNRNFRWDVNLDHLKEVGEYLDLTHLPVWKILEDLVKDTPPHNFTLRSVERLCTLVALSSKPISGWHSTGHNILRASVLMIKVSDSSLYNRILRTEVTKEEFLGAFGLPATLNSQPATESGLISSTEYIFTDGESRVEASTSLFKQDGMYARGYNDMDNLTGAQILEKLAREELETFKLS